MAVLASTLRAQWVDPLSLPRSRALPTGDLDRLSAREAERPRHFLFVCGPFGAFTRRLAAELRRSGARCSRVLLNGGDVLDWGLRDGRPFLGGSGEWNGWLAGLIARDRITDVIIYGDSHPYCVAAKQVAAVHGVAVHVLEQGYFRPFWITLERNGVNARSELPRDPAAYRGAATEPPAVAQWLPPLTPPAVLRIFFYHAALLIGSPVFARYRPPYQVPFLEQAGGHIVRYIGQRLTRRRRRRELRAFLEGSDPVFIGLLQRPGDSQLVQHSPFNSTGEFLDRVVESFARRAPPNARLVFKAHPLDHGLELHGRAIRRAAERLGVADRVYFADQGDLCEMLAWAKGVVTINSTAGLAAIERGVPTTVMGTAIYDIQGLTHQGDLDLFWRAPEPPDLTLFEAFRRVVIARTQINGAYATRRGVDLAAPEAARRLLMA